MPSIERRNFDDPDESYPFLKGRGDTVKVGNHMITRAVFEPGWRWSESLSEAAGTERCEKPHFAYIVSGRLGNNWADGTEVEFIPGDIAVIPPGHEAWVIGDEPVVFLDLHALA